MPPPEQQVSADQIDMRLRALYGETLGRIDEKLKGLDSKLDSVSRDVSVGNVAVKQVMDDHEKRIRALEFRVTMMFAVSMFGSWLLALITPLVHISLTGH